MDAEGRELTIHSVRITQRHHLVAITNLPRTYSPDTYSPDTYSHGYYQENMLMPSTAVLPHRTNCTYKSKIADNILNEGSRRFPRRSTF